MNSKLAIALFALTLPLAGCGNKGPLVMVKPPAAVEAPATPAGEVPVEVVPETTVSDPAPVIPAIAVPPVGPDPIDPPADTDD